MVSYSRIFPVAILLLSIFILNANGQLTFSPDWGKRSIGSSASLNNAGPYFDIQAGNCKSSNEMLLEIIKFVQTQAQIFYDCKHRE